MISLGETFRRVRSELNITQNEMASILGLSEKAVQSYEQGWRPIPWHVQKMATLLLSLKRRSENGRIIRCLDVQRCTSRRRADCPAYQYGRGEFCWLVEGGCCDDAAPRNWRERLARCSKCEAMKHLFRPG